MSSKYVMYDNSEYHIFPGTMNHADIVGGVAQTVTGAGFVCMHPKENRLVCYGYSETLKIGPGEDDEMILNAFMVRHDA